MTNATAVIPTMIVPMICEELRSYLEVALVQNIPEDNPTRAVLVKVGKFQENPLDVNVSIAISPGDFEDPEYVDGRVDNPKFDGLKIANLMVSEIGGGEYWWRRGSIRVQCFFVRQRYDEDVAMRYAYDFLGRLQKKTAEAPLGLLVDDYGERAKPPVYVESHSFFESGGKGKFIWRGKLLWRVLTWRPT
jgi:hypothetical protein